MNYCEINKTSKHTWKDVSITPDPDFNGLFIVKQQCIYCCEWRECSTFFIEAPQTNK